MRKSSLILLLAMAFVLTTVAAGFCVENEIGEPCVACDGDKAGSWKYGLEIKMNKCDPTAQNTTCPCPTFDYELGSNFAGNYCPVQAVEGIIFKLCDCEKIGDMTTSESYAIRLTIMNPAGGVYWTNQNPIRGATVIGNLGYPTYDKPTPDALCAPENAAGNEIRVQTHLDPALSGGNYCLDPNDPSATSNALDYYSLTTGQTLYDPTVHPENCCFTCGANRVKTVQTCYTQLLKNAESVLLIDIPTLVYDPSEIDVQLGAAVQVKVEIVEMPEDGEICVGGCKILCECLVKIGEFADCSPVGCNICIPYMAFGEGWWTGVAFTNFASKAAQLEVTFYAEGSSGSKVVDVPAKSVTPINVGDILDELGLPADAPVYAKVSGGGQIQAFVTIGYGLELTQGYLAPFALMGECGCGHCAGVPADFTAITGTGGLPTPPTPSP